MSENWELGSMFVLRHAGFPFDWVESLGWSDHFVKLLDAVVDAEEQLQADALRTGDKRHVKRVRAALSQGQVSASGLSELWDIEGGVMTWRLARQQCEAAYTHELLHLHKRLHDLASNTKVQEAVFLSNPAVYENMWQSFVDSTDHPDNAHWRRVERIVYTYLQRFCAKNETTSFFGPMGYGEITDTGAFEVSIRGEQHRRTFLAYWAVVELAKAVNRERALRPHLPLHRNPLFKLAPGRITSTVLATEMELDASTERLLTTLSTTVNTIAASAEVLRMDVSEVERLAIPLLKGGVLQRGFTVPVDICNTLEWLQERLGGLPSSSVRMRWLAQLAQLKGKLNTFAQAEFSTRRELLREIEALFTACTGVAPRRSDGQVYADRLVLYEEASSQFHLQMGRDIADDLAQQIRLGLNLSSAYGERVQQDYRRTIIDHVGHQGETLSFMTYAELARPDDSVGSRFSPSNPLEIQSSDDHTCSLSPDICGSPTSGGRYALPDICLIASSPEEIRVGGIRAVLSRVHHHLLVGGWLSIFHPDHRRYDAVAQQWLENEPSAASLVGLELSRRNKGFYSFPGTRFALPGVHVAVKESNVRSVADLTVNIHEDGPRLHDAGGKRLLLYLPLADYTTYPPFAAMAHKLVLHPRIKCAGNHVPRLYIGEAVYQREQWTVKFGHLSRLRGLDLLLAIHRARRNGDWPRFVFVRIANERKPYLIDLLSPFGHELLRHLARNDQPIMLEEMLPGPDDLWLRDELGRYTCELRIQAHSWSDQPNSGTRS